MSDNLRNYTKALYGFDAVVQRVDDGGWDSPSPCAGWTARDVLAHNIGMCDMIAGFASGTGASAPTDPEITDPQSQWAAAREGVLAALDQHGVLDSRADTPWGNLTIDRFIGIVTVDPLTHTFDLARATGQDVVLDEELATAGYAQLAAAGDAIRGPGRFDAAVEIGEDAPMVDKFVAITGRRP